MTVLRRRLFLSFAMLLATAPIAFGPTAASAADDPAVVRARAYCDALLETMKTAKATPVRKRYDKLDPVVRTMFDLPTMTRTAVGPTAWDAMSPADQKSIVDAFSDFTIATYANRFDGYSGERFEVDPAPDVRGDNRLVKTRIVKTSGDPVPINYLMHDTPNGWKAIDVYLGGTISELATRRAEFGAILKSGGVKGLIDRLKAQTERQLGPA